MVGDDDEVFLQNDTKLVASWMQMKELFRHCFRCEMHAEIIKVYTKGVLIYVKLKCNGGHQLSW